MIRGLWTGLAGTAEDKGDEALLAAVARGDRNALATLYDRYGRLAFTVAAAVLRNEAHAEDCTQDAFLNIWRRAGTFDRRRGAARAWIVQIVRNRAVDLLRQQRWASDVSAEDLALTLTDPAPPPEDAAVVGWMRGRVLAALGALTPAHRQILTLAYFEGHTHTEIAARLEMPLGSVKSRIREAVKALRRALREER